MAGLVRAELRLLVEQHEPQARVGLGQGQGGAEAHDTAADDRQVRGLRHGRQNTITMATYSSVRVIGQWSEPSTWGRIVAARTRPRSSSETKK